MIHLKKNKITCLLTKGADEEVLEVLKVMPSYQDNIPLPPVVIEYNDYIYVLCRVVMPMTYAYKQMQIT